MNSIEVGELRAGMKGGERELITKHDMISADMSIADPKLRTFVLLL